MAILCPTCGTPADAGGDIRRVGRLTRCGKCGTAWFARPRAGNAAAAAPADAADVVDEAVVVEEIPTALARPAMAPEAKRLRVPPAVLSALGYTAAALALAAAVVLLKEPLVAALPQIDPAAAATAGLTFQNVRSETVGNGAGRTVIVEGAIVNTQDHAIDLPAVRITLKATDGKDVTSWAVNPSTTRLAAGQSIGFRSARVAPANAASQVTLTLIN